MSILYDKINGPRPLPKAPPRPLPDPSPKSSPEPLPKDTRTETEQFLDKGTEYWSNLGKDNDYGKYGNVVMNFPVVGGLTGQDATEFLSGVVADFPRLASNISKSFTGGNNTGEHKQKTRLKAQKDAAIDGGLMLAGALTGGAARMYINRNSFRAGNAIINNARKAIYKYRRMRGNEDILYKFSSKAGKGRTGDRVKKIGKVVGTGVEIGENTAAAAIRKHLKDNK